MEAREKLWKYKEEKRTKEGKREEKRERTREKDQGEKGKQAA
jgi:hypothetical protein